MSGDSSNEAKNNPKHLSFAQRWRQHHQLPKTFGGVPRVVLTTVFIFIASQFLAALLIQLFITIAGMDTDIVKLSDSATAQFFYVLAAEALTFWLVWKILAHRGLRLGSIGLGRRPRWNDLGKALLGFGAFYLLLIAAGVLISQFLPGLDTDQKQDVGFDNLITPAEQILAFTALVILAPIGEEILVRGYLYSGLRSKLNFGLSAIITSVIFAAAHLQTGSGTVLLWAAAINTFILSLILVYLREKTGALYAGIAVHSLNNLVAYGVYFHALLI